MKKLMITLSIYFLFTTSLLAASVYDGIWEIKGLHVTDIEPSGIKLPVILPEKPSALVEGPIEKYLIITKYGNRGIILIIPDFGVFPNEKTTIIGTFRMTKEKELYADLRPLPIWFTLNVGVIPEIPHHLVSITFNDTQTASYQRRFLAPLCQTPLCPNLREGIDFVPGEIIVNFKPGIPENEKIRIFQEHGVTVKAFLDFTGSFVLKLPPNASVIEYVERFRVLPEVQYAQPNFILTLDVGLTEPVFMEKATQSSPAPSAFTIKGTLHKIAEPSD